MMNISALTDLYRHMEWADARVWQAAFASAGAQADEKLRDTFYHLHLVQRAFLRVWRNEPGEMSYPTFEDAPSLMQWGRDYYPEAFAYLDTLSDEKAVYPMPLAWASMVERQLGRAPETTTVGETVLQVALHSLYHRGQINARLRSLDGEPPLVDYIAWVWLGRPAADWPSESQPSQERG